MFLGSAETTKTVLICLVCIIVIAARSSRLIYWPDGVPDSDSLCYHFTILSWMNAAKAVKGLANLHYRLGMNSAYLQLAAGLDVGVFDKYCAYIMLPVFTLVFDLYCLFEIVYGKKREKALAASMLVWIILFNRWLPSVLYDVPSLMFMAISYYEVLRRWTDDGESCQADRSVLLLLATMGFCIKQMGAVMLLCVFAYLLFDMKKKRCLSFQAVLPIIALPAVFAVVYVARNVIQTGYPLYPLPVLRLPLKWTATDDNIYDCYNAIKYWAKWPAAGYMAVKDNPFMYWFAPWIKRAVSTSNFMCVAMLFLSLGICIPVMKKHWKRALFPLFMVLSSMVYWFVAAPDFRFGSVLFFLLFGTVLYFCFYNEGERGSALSFLEGMGIAAAITVFVIVPLVCQFLPCIKSWMLSRDYTFAAMLFLSAAVIMPFVSKKRDKALLFALIIAACEVFWVASGSGYRHILFYLVAASAAYFCYFRGKSVSMRCAVVMMVAVTAFVVLPMLKDLMKDGVTFHHWISRRYDNMLKLEAIYLLAMFAVVPVRGCNKRRNPFIVVASLCIVFCVCGYLFQKRHNLAGEFAEDMQDISYEMQKRTKGVFSMPIPVESRPAHLVTLKNGQEPPLLVWTSDDGGACGDAPLPCTPYLDNRLKCLVAGEPLKGFWVDESLEK